MNIQETLASGRHLIAVPSGTYTRCTIADGEGANFVLHNVRGQSDTFCSEASEASGGAPLAFSLFEGAGLAIMLRGGEDTFLDIENTSDDDQDFSATFE